MHDLATRRSELESAVINQLDATGVGITASVEAKGGDFVVHLKLSPESLTLTQRDGEWNGKIEELFIEKNDAGGELAHVKLERQFGIKAAGKADYDRRGAVLTQSVRAVPGATKLVIAVRDSVSGRTGSLTAPLHFGAVQ
jgi:hypothetical protein